MPKKQSEGLRFLNVNIENFKNISKKQIDIGGESIMIIGRNSAGKSSFLQALTSPLDSKQLPTEAIKQGEERGKIEVTLGGTMGGVEKKYILELFFTPKNQSGRLVVTNELGEAISSPAQFVKSLIGKVSFDPIKFISEPKAKKLETIKALTGCAVTIDGINAIIKGYKDNKKMRKARVEEIEAVLKNHGYSQEEINKYSTKIDLTSLQEEMIGISRGFENYSTVESKVKGFLNDIELRTASNDDLRAQIKALEASILYNDSEIVKNEQNVLKGNEWLRKNPKPSVEVINTKINEAIAHNQECDRIERHADQQREMLQFKDDISAIDTKIEGEEKKRSKVISESQLPIPGLTFTDEDLFIDGLPLEEGQVNTARIFDIGVDVAMAMNPNLKVIFLSNGNLFDKEHLKAIVDKIEERGYQVIIEMVSWSGKELEVKFTEAELK